ncbi:MAG: hypothetical protein JWM83_20 [Candidatus Angelobacter sp.]|nr:hypothetical protein [Candidatus Angelobacter sp.]
MYVVVPGAIIFQSLKCVREAALTCFSDRQQLANNCRSLLRNNCLRQKKSDFYESGTPNRNMEEMKSEETPKGVVCIASSCYTAVFTRAAKFETNRGDIYEF